jgi:RNA polymerase sigma factor (sigma-70 family)
MTASADTTVNLIDIVEQIRADDPSGMKALYEIFERGIRFYLLRQLGPRDLEDRVHDTFLIVVHAIRHGELREPERLMGFVRTIVRRQVAAHIERAIAVRRQQADLDSGMMIASHGDNPEESAISRQRREVALGVLRAVSRRDREILTRFYLLGQSQEMICAEMNLTDTQFRLLKSRAKERFGEIGKRRLELR